MEFLGRLRRKKEVVEDVKEQTRYEKTPERRIKRYTSEGKPVYY
jgi:hypothetical protein